MMNQFVLEGQITSAGTHGGPNYVVLTSVKGKEYRVLIDNTTYAVALVSLGKIMRVSGRLDYDDDLFEFTPVPTAFSIMELDSWVNGTVGEFVSRETLAPEFYYIERANDVMSPYYVLNYGPDGIEIQNEDGFGGALLDMNEKIAYIRKRLAHRQLLDI